MVSNSDSVCRTINLKFICPKFGYQWTHAARPTQHFAFNYHTPISTILVLESCETYTCPSSWAIVNAALSPLSWNLGWEDLKNKIYLTFFTWTIAQLLRLHIVPSSARPRVSQFSLLRSGCRQIFSLNLIIFIWYILISTCIMLAHFMFCILMDLSKAYHSVNLGDKINLTWLLQGKWNAGH